MKHTIRRYELGKLNPKYETIQRIATALEVPVDYFLNRDPVTELKILSKKLNQIDVFFYKNIIERLQTVGEQGLLVAEKFKRSMLEEAYDSMNDNGQNKVIEYAQDSVFIR